MKTPRNRVTVPAFLIVALYAVSAPGLSAAEIDFSCMSYKVWGKSHLSDRYRTYDIVLQNNCPGSVYWSMCIERMDPYTHKIKETHAPVGYVEKEKKARVNLQMKQGPDESRFRNRFQEFYVSLGYAIEPPAQAACVASRCEAKKSELRSAIQANEAAWAKAEKALTVRLAEECPDTGWGTDSDDECKSAVRGEAQPELDQFELVDSELREEMAAVDPELCEIYSGELVEN